MNLRIHLHFVDLLVLGTEPCGDWNSACGGLCSFLCQYFLHFLRAGARQTSKLDLELPLALSRPD